MKVKFKIKGKERECELRVCPNDNELMLIIENWAICAIDADTRKLHRCLYIDADDTGLKLDKFDRVKLAEDK